MMKAKKLLSVLLAGMMLVSNGVTVLASEVDVSGGTASGTTPTSFEVDTSVLGGDLVVSIPAEMVLTYNTDDEQFKNEDVVSAKGRIRANKKLQVKTPTSIEYSNGDDNSIKVAGTVAFGITSDNLQVTEWSASELLDSLTVLSSKDITATVEKDDISYIGTYSTNITYDINVVDK